ncbi:MAG TPA: protein-L-isoaspartate(D-aspartate) O-methyltransferase [Candidatus Binatia bacterium]|jgi:protein-L-isoaspartate(D-aspartate) O-methyltransferase
MPDRSPTAYIRAREKMVQEQVVGRGVKDPRVAEAMRKVPREFFVESALASRAYDDGPLPIGEKQTISQPYMVGLMTEALELKGEEKVLEVGTGSGYQTSVLGLLAAQVFSIEKIRPLSARARAVLDELHYYNVALHVGDGTIGWSDHAPYDAIIVTAGAPPNIPKPLLDQLAPGGRLVIPLGDEESQVLKRIRRTESGFQEENLGECRFVKLWGKYGWAD